MIPAHKPKTLPDGVRRLRELNDQFMVAADTRRTELKDIEIAFDIAGWLSEIAADSEMPEREWNEVKAHADVLVALYRRILNTTFPQPDLVEEANVEIGHLENRLRSSEPRWFYGTNRNAAAR